MAVPVGTTSRQIDATGRWIGGAGWALAALVLWRPSHAAWAAWMVLLAVMSCVWVLRRVTARTRTLTGHPLFVALVPPAAVLACHMVHREQGGAPTGRLITNALNVSILIQLALAALGLLLAQSVLAPALRRLWPRAGLGAIVMVGALATATDPLAYGMRASAVMAFLAGGMILCSAAAEGLDRLARRRPAARWRELLRTAPLAGWSLAVLVIAPQHPESALLGVVLALAGGGVTWLSRRRPTVAVAVGPAGLAVVGVVAVLLAQPTGLAEAITAGGLLGRGERAFAMVTAADRGVTVLLVTLGYVPVVVSAVISAVGLMVLLADHRQGHEAVSAAPSVWWASACLMSVAAVLAPGGLFSPATNLLAVTVWGAAGTVFGCRRRPRSGLWALGAATCVFAMLALGGRTNLVSWSLGTLGMGDKALHVAVGLLLALLAGWQLGGGRAVRTAGVVCIVAAMGGVGEGVQWLLTDRSVEWMDWAAHAVGAGGAGVLLLSALGALACESPDVSLPRASGYDEPLLPGGPAALRANQRRSPSSPSER